MSGHRPRRPGRSRRPRLGLRRETAILVPAAFFLAVVLSVFTLLSYRSAVELLVEERRAEALTLAERIAAEAAAGDLGGDRLRSLAGTARGAALLGPDGSVVARAGSLPGGALLPPRAEEREQTPLALGPDLDLGGVVVAFAPTGTGGWVRVDLGATTLALQRRTLTLLTWVVVVADAALTLLVLLFLGRMMAPYDSLLERARRAGASPDQADDEITFLLDTFERALEGLSRPPEGAEDDIAALQRTLGVSLESGVLLLDRSGAVLALNETGARLLGIPKPRPDTRMEDLVRERPELAAPVELIRDAVESGRKVRRQEVRLGDGPGGASRTLGLTVHPLQREDGTPADDGGAVRGFLVLFADLTEVRRQRERAQLAESLRQLGELAAGVAHELRNSLATVKGYLGLIDREAEKAEAGIPPEVEDSLAEIRQEAEHLQRVLEDFLSFARPGTARLEPVDLAAVAERAAADPALRSSGVRFEIDRRAAAGEAVISGDPQLLERALRNLLHNAAEASAGAARRGGEEARVEVTVEARGDGVRMSVADRGPGLAEEVREHLFEPFTSGRPGGVGLGLALARRIVLLHGGTLELVDRPGGGTIALALFPPGETVTNGNGGLPPGGSTDSATNRE